MGGHPPLPSFLLGDPRREPKDSRGGPAAGAPKLTPWESRPGNWRVCGALSASTPGFSAGRPPPRRGVQRVPDALSVPVLRFPVGEPQTETWGIWGSTAAPVPAFLLKDPEWEPGGFRGTPSPRTNLAGRRTWRARLGGSGSAVIQLLPSGILVGVAPFLLCPPKC